MGRGAQRSHSPSPRVRKSHGMVTFLRATPSNFKRMVRQKSLRDAKGRKSGSGRPEWRQDTPGT